MISSNPKREIILSMLCDRLYNVSLSNDPFMFFCDTRCTDGFSMILLSSPIKQISCIHPQNIDETLATIQRYHEKGFICAGYIAYEAGYAFEQKLSQNTQQNNSAPLLWFGVFERTDRTSVDTEQLVAWMERYTQQQSFSIQHTGNDVTEAEYKSNIEIIKKYISAGDVYQINYTFKHHFAFNGSPFALFCELNRTQPVGYAAYMQFDDTSVISLSPELFFSIENDRITTRPMKGTARRGHTIPEDTTQKNQLQSCMKNRAENVMIVDLLRNDLNRICTTGSVDASRLFEIEQYATLFQMVSTVSGIKRPHCTFSDIIKNIFPSGSITGAPKIRAMQLIRELETHPRGVYTGSIGYLLPDGTAHFNVAIRTALIDKSTGMGELGIGSGIVSDSNPEEEWRECLLKSAFLTRRVPPFKLIETILWENGSYFLYDLHLQRLMKSAQFFQFNIKITAIDQHLTAMQAQFTQTDRYKVRLVVDRYGVLDVTAQAVSSESQNMSGAIIVSSKTMQTGNVFLYHKTTNRDIYNTEYARWHKQGYMDVLFRNEFGYITEGAISNIFIQKGDCYITPPVAAGILNGTYRQHFINNHRKQSIEQNITIEDILNADAVYQVNSVRKMMRVNRIDLEKHIHTCRKV